MSLGGAFEASDGLAYSHLVGAGVCKSDSSPGLVFPYMKIVRRSGWWEGEEPKCGSLWLEECRLYFYLNRRLIKRVTKHEEKAVKAFPKG